MPVAPEFHALVPAAGSGARMGTEIPKQYQLLAGKPLIWHAVNQLCAHLRIKQVFVVLAPGDTQFARIEWSIAKDKIIPLYCGGETRSASVRNGLAAMASAVDADDWMLVHDAARPCLTPALIDRLLTALEHDATGGLLAVPVADTLKRADAQQRVLGTESREQLWQAQTPQMFRYGLLVEALSVANLGTVTDEASAVEQRGFKPKLVMGSLRNLKVTFPEDLDIAKNIIKTNT